MRFLLVLIFIVVPIAELALLIQVGQAIGVWWTIALLIADSILGSLLMRSQGRAAWRRFNVALQAGRPPAREVLDGVLVIFGGALLLTPGFISDILGLMLLLPPTRAVVRRILVAPLRRPHDRLGDARRDGRLRASARSRRHPARRRRGHGRRRRRGRPAAGLAMSEPVLTGAEGFTDAVTFAFADPRRRVLRARARRRRLRPEGLQGSALAVLFAGREPVGVVAEGGLALAADADWDELQMPGHGRPHARAARELAGRRRHARRSGLRPRVHGRVAAGGAGRGRRGGAPGRHGRPRAAVPRHRHGRRARDRLPRPARPLLGHRRLGAGSRSRAPCPPGSRTAARVTVAAVRPPAPRATPTRRPGARCSTREGAVARRRPARLDDLRRRRPPAPRGPRAVGRRGGRLPAPRRRAGAVRLLRRARTAAARLRVLRLAARRPRGRRALRPASAARLARQFSQPSRSQQ